MGCFVFFCYFSYMRLSSAIPHLSGNSWNFAPESKNICIRLVSWIAPITMIAHSAVCINLLSQDSWYHKQYFSHSVIRSEREIIWPTELDLGRRREEGSFLTGGPSVISQVTLCVIWEFVWEKQSLKLRWNKWSKSDKSYQQSVNIVTWSRCRCLYEVSGRFEYFYIIWPYSVIIRDKVGQNRSIYLQSCSESAPNFTRKNKHTYILRRQIHKVVP